MNGTRKGLVINVYRGTTILVMQHIHVHSFVLPSVCVSIGQLLQYRSKPLVFWTESVNYRYLKRRQKRLTKKLSKFVTIFLLLALVL